MKSKNLFFIIGTICILIAAAIFAKNMMENYEVDKKTQSIAQKVIDNQDDKSNQKGKYLENPKMEMPIKEIDGQEYIGYLNINSLGLELPILSSWSYPKIKIAPARYQGSIYQNDMVILAHNYPAHFGELYRLKTNDRIEFSDMDNNKFVFKVTSQDEIRGDQVDKLLAGDWDLTLFTCTLSGEFRTVIRCELVEDVSQ